MAATRSIVIATAVVLGACSANDPAPPDWQRTAAEAERSPYGAWMQVETSAHVFAGELLAVSDDSLFIAQGDGIARVGMGDVRKAVLSAHQTSGAGVGTLGALGAVSTISHGFFLVLSMPVWLVASGGSVRAHTKSGFLSYTAGAEGSPDLRTWRKWARFPQGIPPGYRPGGSTRPPAAEPPVSRGQLDAPCYPNGSCNRGLVCDGERCRQPAEPGQLDGRCYGTGQCEAGLYCVDDRCRAAPVDSPSRDAGPVSGDAGP